MDVQDVGPIELHHEAYGSGRPIILLHGFGANSYCWKKTITQLSQECRVITIDLKGFGASPKPRDKAYSISDQAMLIGDFIRGNGLRNSVIVGHSLGGGVALMTTLNLAREDSDRVSGLVLVDSIAYPQKLPPFIKVLRTPVVGNLGLLLFSSKRHVQSVLKKAYYNDAKITDEAIAAYAQPMDLPGGRYALVETAKQIIPKDIQNLCSRYKDIHVPTLIIWGRNDEIVPLGVGRRLHKAIPNSDLVIIEDCGHMPQEENPSEVTDAILKFLKNHRTPQEIR